MGSIGWAMMAILVLLSPCSNHYNNEIITETRDKKSGLPRDLDVQTVVSLRDSIPILLVDVRKKWEYEQASIPGVRLIPLAELPDRFSEIPPDTVAIMICRGGVRSGYATDYLRERGYGKIYNMKGGMLAWQRAGLFTKQE